VLRISVAAGIATMLAAMGSADPLHSPPAVCPESSSLTFFFPQSTFHPKPDLDGFVRKWYSHQLSAMKEPSLSCGVAPGTEAYRSTWLRTFHHPIAVRISWSEERGELTSVELDGAGGYEPGSILKTGHRPLPKGEWSVLKASVERLKFWAMPTRLSADLSGADGAQWIIEGRRGDEYHIVDRWSPKTGSYRDVGLQFLRLAGIIVPAREVY
jgi:hypothetical protein